MRCRREIGMKLEDATSEDFGERSKEKTENTLVKCYNYCKKRKFSV